MITTIITQTTLSNTKRLSKRLVFTLLATLFFSNFMIGQEWIGTTGDWDDPNNWDTGTVPGNGDDVFVSNGGIINVNGSARSVYSITLEDGTIQGTESISMNEFYWYGGSIHGSGDFEVTEYMEIDGSGFSISGRHFISRGDCFWFSGNIDIASSANFEVTDGAYFSAEHGQNLSIGTGGGKFLLSLGGIFENTFGSNTSIAGVMEVQTGEITVASGSLIFAGSSTHPFDECTINLGGSGKMIVNGGVVNLQSSTDVFGTGWIDIDGGTLALNGNNNIFSKVNFISGQIGGTTNASFKSSFNWQGGTFNSTETITVTLIEILTSSSKTVGSGTLTISSSGNWVAGDIDIDAGATFQTATGTSFNINSTGSHTFGSSASGNIILGGLATKANNSVTVLSSNLTVGNTGTIKVDAGQFQTNGNSSGSYNGSISISTGAIFDIAGGNHNINVGTAYGAGTFLVSSGVITCASGTKLITKLNITGGTLNNETNLAPITYEQSGGTLSGNGNVTVNGPMLWNGGSVIGAGTFTVKGTADWEAGVRTLSEKTMVYEDEVEWLGGDFIFQNSALIRIESTSMLSVTHTGTQEATGSGTFQVDGTIEKYHSNSITNINITYILNGMAKGNGTINFGTLNNFGTVAPGHSIGSLTVDDFDNTGATLEIEIESIAPKGTGYDHLEVTVGGTFNGTLDVSLLNNFVPEVGDAFEVIKCDNCTGTFTTINIPTLPTDRIWEFDYDKGLTILVSAQALPVELSDFDVRLQGDRAILNWRTASEFNNKGFFVEKRTVTGDFMSIGFVEGVGFSQTDADYQFTDNELVEGYNVYRLKQIDFDGAYAYSELRQVRYTRQEAQGISVYPNPSNGRSLNVSYDQHTNDEVPGMLNIYNQNGQKIYSRHLDADMVKQPLQLNDIDLTAGLYVVAIESAMDAERIKLVVK